MAVPTTQYILHIFVRKLDIFNHGAAYGVYNDAQHLIRSLTTDKYAGVWRREACFGCNYSNCGGTEEECLQGDTNYMTTVAILCENSSAARAALDNLQANLETHSVKQLIFPDLSQANAELIKTKIAFLSLNQKLSRNSQDWLSQNTTIAMEDDEYSGPLSFFYNVGPPLREEEFGEEELVQVLMQ